jgi:small subunit ribosomal protein S17e
MGRIRTKTVKRASRELIEKYYQKLTEDFHLNKKIIDSVAVVPTKRLRNKIAGFTTHMMKRIAKGPVQGISLKIQEEQREKMFDIVPDRSHIQVSEPFETTDDVMKMLKDAGMNNLVKNKNVTKKTLGIMDEDN